jgi:hypothetical protein
MKPRSDRRAARRQGAAARFKILSKDQYIETSLARSRNRMTIGDGDAGYAAYVERKKAEARSLGILA